MMALRLFKAYRQVSRYGRYDAIVISDAKLQLTHPRRLFGAKMGVTAIGSPSNRSLRTGHGSRSCSTIRNDERDDRYRALCNRKRDRLLGNHADDIAVLCNTKQQQISGACGDSKNVDILARRPFHL